MGAVHGGGQHRMKSDGKNFRGCSLERNFVSFFFSPPFIYGFLIITTVRKGLGLLCAAAAASLVSVRCSRPRSSTDTLAGGARCLIASSRLETAKRSSASGNSTGWQ